MNLVDELTDRDEEQARAKRINGAVTGLITNNKDPDKLGRVKVAFPWLSENNESDWVRIAVLMAGKNRGSFFLPEVGDEVLVVFEHGDIDYPYVIGALWNSKDTPPETNSDGKNNIRKITSRSGHEIILNDDHEGKKENVEIHTNAGHKILLDDTSGKEKIETQSKSGHTILLNDAGGKERIEIVDKSGSNKIVIDTGKKAIDIESGMQIKLKSQKIDIEASASLTLKSNGITTIKGMPVKIN